MVPKKLKQDLLHRPCWTCMFSILCHGRHFASPNGKVCSKKRPQRRCSIVWQRLDAEFGFCMRDCRSKLSLLQDPQASAAMNVLAAAVKAGLCTCAQKKNIQANWSLQEKTLVDVAEQSLQKLSTASSSGSRPMRWQFACMAIVCCIHGLCLHAYMYLFFLLHARLLMQFPACMVFACCILLTNPRQPTHGNMSCMTRAFSFMILELHAW